MGAAASPTAISDSELCPEIVEAVLHFSRIAHEMQGNSLVDSAEVVQPVAKAASSPGVLAAVFVHCRSFLHLGRAGENSVPPGCQVCIHVPYHSQVLVSFAFLALPALNSFISISKSSARRHHARMNFFALLMPCIVSSLQPMGYLMIPQEETHEPLLAVLLFFLHGLTRDPTLLPQSSKAPFG